MKKVKLRFEEGKELSLFTSVAECKEMEVNLEQLTVTSNYNLKDVELALSAFRATVVE